MVMNYKLQKWWTCQTVWASGSAEHKKWPPPSLAWEYSHMRNWNCFLALHSDFFFPPCFLERRSRNPWLNFFSFPQNEAEKRRTTLRSVRLSSSFFPFASPSIIRLNSTSGNYRTLRAIRDNDDRCAVPLVAVKYAKILKCCHGMRWILTWIMETHGHRFAQPYSPLLFPFFSCVS